MNQTNDGFTNLVSNLGGANGKTRANSYVLTPQSQQQIDTAYRTSTWFGKIVDIPADDATREWRSWKAESEQIELIEATEKRLGVQHKVNKALKWSRLYGGAVIIPDLPGISAEEYVPSAYQTRFLHVLSRYEITAHGVNRDPLSRYFGQPEYYTIQSQQGVETRFHPSRVVLVNGRTTGTELTDIWGDSIWMHLADSILASDSGAAAIAALLQEAKVDVVRIANFMDGLASGTKYEADVQRRWDLVAILKSVANVVLLDKDDEWDQKTVNWTGLPDVMRTLLTVMAGAADIPVTRLIGTSAAGLNATGEGDLRNYYDSVKAKQDLVIAPMLAPLDDIILWSALGERPPEVWYDWKPLWQPSEKERAETQKLRAETYQIELMTGAIDEAALTKSYLNAAIESGLYPGLEGAIAESADEGLATLGDAAPRTLYVARHLTNVAELRAWAEGQGLTLLDDPHVTITYSRQPVDWMRMGQAWQASLEVEPGGPRVMEMFGPDKRTLVLLFSSIELEWRHEAMVEKGASWDWPEYQPHVTIQAEWDGDVTAIEPYQGRLVFGPEIFEEVRED